MKSLSGVISDRLRRMFAPDDPIWHPGRPTAAITRTYRPGSIDGHRMTGRRPRK